MKNILLLTFLFLGTFVYSQQSHFGLNMGPSFPLNDFAASNDYQTNGYARPGFNLSFDGNFIPTWYFGIGGAITFSTNYPNQDSMLAGLIEELKKMESLPVIPEGVDAQFTIGQWSYVNILVGPTFAYPAGRFQFNVKALFGVSIVMPPNQTLTLEIDESLISGYSDTQDAKFCYNFGADVIFELSGSYSLKFGAEYFHTTTDHTMDIGYDENVPISIPRKIEIESVQTTIGFAYLF